MIKYFVVNLFSIAFDTSEIRGFDPREKPTRLSPGCVLNQLDAGMNSKEIVKFNINFEKKPNERNRIPNSSKFDPLLNLLVKNKLNWILSMELCVLVNTNDEVIGTEEKLSVHQSGNLHRAFSVFVLNEKAEIMLQKRAQEKYHSPGLWTNSCCSHPRPDESVLAAGERRLMEELGFTTALQPAFSFIYKAEVGNGFIEHEFDHVLLGEYSGNVPFNPAEVSEIRFISLSDLKAEVLANPSSFTQWLCIMLTEHCDSLKKAIDAFR